MLKSVHLLLALAGLICITDAAKGQTWGGLYDMSQILKEPHPFDHATTNQIPSSRLAPRLPSPNRKLLLPTTTHTSSPTPKFENDLEKEWKWSNIFSEIRLGALLHDYGPFSRNEEDGFDGNIEMLFLSPKALSFISSPRPHVGISYNSAGDTSYAYGGLYWEWSFWDEWFAGFSLGGMVHDGRLVGDKDGKLKKSLGCRMLFREAVNFGYRFKKHHAIMIHLNHSSNASLCKKNTPDGTAEGRHNVILNEGLESLGIRYGYMF